MEPEPRDERPIILLAWPESCSSGTSTTAGNLVFVVRNGGELQATAHGDSFWLFSLDGTMGPAAAPGTGTGTQHAGEGGGGGTTIGDAAAGRSVFADNCATCHGSLGTGGNGGPDLTSFPNAKQVAVVTRQVTKGGGGMPAFQGTLTKKQIADVAAYVTKNITNTK